ncbi:MULTISPECIES: aspartate aminotransferase family protein [unclassified Inquilinus]|uniref:aspartate aminotransferase family protein n=1 Tax=unclassified Inquilinus TaxID=2645927 RepID=UPI003F8EF0BD
MPLVTRDAAAIAAIEKLRFGPFAARSGNGRHLVADDGRRVIDFSASWGAASLGHGHPALVEAVGRAVATMPGASLLSLINEPAVALAEKLLSITPGGGDRRVWFGHSGSDANETVVRAVEAATGKRRVIAFVGAYHGGTALSMSVSGHTAQTHSPPRAGLFLLPYPDPYRPHFPGAVGEAALAQLDYLLATVCPPSDTAAVIVEAIQADGGLLVPPPGFLPALAERCRLHGILLVCDEVKVGLGRTGLLHAFQAESLTPDLVSFGKGLGGGLPLSAVVGPAAILDHRTAFAMQTLCGNPVSCSAGLAVLDTIAAEGLVENAAARGLELANGLRRLADRHEAIGDIRGRGLAVGVELVENRESRAPAGSLCQAVVYRSWELGLLLFYVGARSNVLEITPALTITTAEIEEGLAVLDLALQDAASGRVDAAAVAAYAGW